MPLTLTTVTGPIYLPNGATPFGGRVSFELSSWDVELEAGLVVSGPVYETIDENGQFSVELYTSSAGEHSVTYRMYVIWDDSTLSQSYVNDIYISQPTPHYTKKYIGSFSLSGPGPYRLDELNIVSELNNDSFNAYLEMKAFVDRIDLGALDSSVLAAQNAAISSQQAETTTVNATANAQTYRDEALAARDTTQTLRDEVIVAEAGIDAAVDKRILIYSSRDDFVSAIPSLSPVSGSVVNAGGFLYTYTGTGGIHDLPGWHPLMANHAEHHGAKPDLDWVLADGLMPAPNDTAIGPRRVSGTDNYNAFAEAFRYGASMNKDVIAGGSGYYIRSFERFSVFGLTYAFDIVVDDLNDLEVGLYDAEADEFAPVGAEGRYNHEYLKRDVHYTVSLNPDGRGGVITILDAATLTNTLSGTPYDELEVRVQFNPKVSLRSGNEYKTVLWCHYALSQQGIRLGVSNVSVEGFRVIGQHNRNGFKPDNVGQMGVIACHGGFYYRDTAMPKVEGTKLDILVCRAERILSDPSNGIAFQDSDSAIATGAFGWVEDFKHRVGFFGKTNIACNHLSLFHWGAQYDPASVSGDVYEAISAELIESYGPYNFDLQFNGEVDGSKNPIGSRVWELACAGPGTVGPLVARNVPEMYWIGIGDVATAYHVDHQRTSALRGIHVGMQVGRNLAPTAYAALWKFLGTSKVASELNDVGQGGDIQRVGAFKITCEGHDFECVPGTPEGIRVRELLGDVDLGDVRVRGATKPIYGLHGNGILQYRLYSSEGTPEHVEQGSVTVRGLYVNKGDDRNYVTTLPNDYDSGWESNNYAAIFRGAFYQTTVSAAGVAGDTDVSIAPFVDTFAKVLPGDRVRIDGFSYVATAVTQVGGNIITIAGGLKRAVSGGATVELDHRCVVDGLTVNAASSENGILLKDTVAHHVNCSGARWSGRFLLDIDGRSLVQLEGILPASEGMVTGTHRRVSVEAQSRVVGHNLHIPYNATEDAVFLISSASPHKGTLTLIGGEVENAANLYNCTYPTQQVHLFGTVDGEGTPLTVV